MFHTCGLGFGVETFVGFIILVLVLNLGVLAFVCLGWVIDTPIEGCCNIVF